MLKKTAQSTAKLEAAAAAAGGSCSLETDTVDTVQKQQLAEAKAREAEAEACVAVLEESLRAQDVELTAAVDGFKGALRTIDLLQSEVKDEPEVQEMETQTTDDVCSQAACTSRQEMSTQTELPQSVVCATHAAPPLSEEEDAGSLEPEGSSPAEGAGHSSMAEEEEGEAIVLAHCGLADRALSAYCLEKVQEAPSVFQEMRDQCFARAGQKMDGQVLLGIAKAMCAATNGRVVIEASPMSTGFIDIDMSPLVVLPQTEVALLVHFFAEEKDVAAHFSVTAVDSVCAPHRIRTVPVH